MRKGPCSDDSVPHTLACGKAYAAPLIVAAYRPHRQRNASSESSRDSPAAKRLVRILDRLFELGSAFRIAAVMP